MKRLLIGLLWLLSPMSCYSDSFTVGMAGVREHGALGTYKAITVDWQPAEYLVLSAGSIFGGHPEPELNGNTFDVKWAGAGVILREGHLFDSIEYVKLNHQTYHLTSPYQFYITFGVEQDGYSLSYRHLSNAGTGGANYGEDMVVLAYRW